jgi:hypothetical protein
MVAAAVSFGLLMLLPTDFRYPEFALILALTGISMGMFASPNRAGVMNSLPAADRGAGGGMNQTFQNYAQVLSIGIFFTLRILGLAATLPDTLLGGLQAHGVSHATAERLAHLPPVRSCSRRSSGTTPSSTCWAMAGFTPCPPTTRRRSPGRRSSRT